MKSTAAVYSSSSRCFLLFWVCVYFIATSSGNAFLYSRF